jgi:tetratricopeptide (TPR) repeat protein
MRVLPIAVMTALVGVCAVTLLAQTREEDWKQCVSHDPDLSITGCTPLIQSGQETGAKLAKAFYNRGNAYLRKREYDRAIQDDDEAIRLDPSNALALNSRGIAHKDKGEYDRAIQDYDEAIRLNPSYASAFNNRGIVYVDKGEYDRAIQDYGEAIRLDPSFASAFNNRGAAYDAIGDYDRAIQNFDEAIELNPSYEEALYNRGIAYSGKSEYDRAIQDYDQAILLNPNDALAFNNRGNAYRGKGEYDRAIQNYDQAIKLDPSDKYAFRARSTARFLVGEFAAAEPDFAEVLKANPSDAYLALWLYLAQARTGKDGRSVLEQNSKQIDLTAWPGQAIELYLGSASPAAVLSAAGDPDLNKSQSQHCEAYFFLAEKALLESDREAARSLLQKALDTGAIREMHYAAAQAELKRLQTAGTNSHQ